MRKIIFIPIVCSICLVVACRDNIPKGQATDPAKKVSETGKQNTPPATANSTMWLILPVALSLISMGYAYFSGDQLKKKVKSLEKQLADSFNETRKADEKSEKFLQELLVVKEDIKSFDGFLDNVWAEIDKLKMNTVHDNYQEKEQPLRKSASPASFTELNTDRQQKPAVSENNREPLPALPLKEDFRPAVAKPAAFKRKYAKYADTGDGFSLSELTDEPDNEKIFEIDIVKTNGATFRVVSNSNAQQFALSNPSYYLDKICKSDSAPTPGCKIITETPGELRLAGNKWIIVNMAKINFT